MRRRLSRQTFLKVAAAAAIGLGFAQAGVFVYQAANSAPVTLRPTPVASSIQRPPDPEPLRRPVASSIQRPPVPASAPTAVVSSTQQPPHWPCSRANLG